MLDSQATTGMSAEPRVESQHEILEDYDCATFGNQALNLPRGDGPVAIHLCEKMKREKVGKKQGSVFICLIRMVKNVIGYNAYSSTKEGKGIVEKGGRRRPQLENRVFVSKAMVRKKG